MSVKHRLMEKEYFNIKIFMSNKIFHPFQEKLLVSFTAIKVIEKAVVFSKSSHNN